MSAKLSAAQLSDAFLGCEITSEEAASRGTRHAARDKECASDLRGNLREVLRETLRGRPSLAHSDGNLSAEASRNIRGPGHGAICTSSREGAGRYESSALQ